MANHTIKLELSKDEAAHFQQTHAEFHFSYGIALANWAAVERALFYWFYRATEMGEAMARAVFYSARSFNGRAEMLEAAIAHNPTLVGDETAFIRAGIKKAWQYNSFRNRLAHGEPLIDIIETNEGEKTSRSINWKIVQGKSQRPDPGTEVSIERLRNAAAHFHRLQCLLTDALGPDKQHREYLEQVQKLPNQADSPCDHNFSKP